MTSEASPGNGPVTEVIQTWGVRGGQMWLGMALPFTIGAFCLLVIGRAVYGVQSVSIGVGPSVFLFMLAGLLGWLVWKVLGTVTTVGRTTDDKLTCKAARRSWTLASDDAVAVKGDAYGLFLVIVTCDSKIWIWAWIEDRTGLLGAIRRASPQVEVDAYADSRDRRSR